MVVATLSRWLGLRPDERRPQVGDSVSHDGWFRAFRITALPVQSYIDGQGRPQVLELCVFENAQRQVVCRLDELVWLEEDKSWMLPGRLLSEEQRRRWRDLMSRDTGVPVQGPPADKHVEARAFLKQRGAL